MYYFIFGHINVLVVGAEIALLGFRVLLPLPTHTRFIFMSADIILYGEKIATGAHCTINC